ncbi:MAG: FMN-binding protein [Ruminococcaceae bacterium]|nr:FMN-binding protein [Oscillospiraceae bacterium]
MTKRAKSILFGTAAALLLIAVVWGFSYLNRVSSYKNEVNTLAVGDVDFSQVADGVYIGDCDVEFIYAKVQVTVENGKATDIQILEHRNERGAPAETIIDAVLQEQSLSVDTVSGATNSSRVILKAVENAVSQKQQ